MLLGAGRLRNVISADTHHHRQPSTGRGFVTRCQTYHAFMLFCIPRSLDSPHVFALLYLFLCFFVFFLCQTRAPLHTLLLVWVEKGGLTPRKEQGAGRRLTPGVQTAANGEQVWRRERGERRREKDEERGEEEKKRWMLPPPRSKLKTVRVRRALLACDSVAVH